MAKPKPKRNETRLRYKMTFSANKLGITKGVARLTRVQSMMRLSTNLNYIITLFSVVYFVSDF